MAAIDWHSFVVLETITFHPDEEAYLPPPKRTIAEMEATIAELAIEEEREREDREARDKAKADAVAAQEPPLFHPGAPSGVDSVPAGEGVLEHVDEALEIRAAAPAGVGAQGVGAGAGAKLVTCVVCGDTIAGGGPGGAPEDRAAGPAVEGAAADADGPAEGEQPRGREEPQ